MHYLNHTEKPFLNPGSVIEYLARYTHKIAITHYRIKSVKDGGVEKIMLMAVKAR